MRNKITLVSIQIKSCYIMYTPTTNVLQKAKLLI